MIRHARWLIRSAEEDAADLETFDERAGEPTIEFEEFIESLRQSDEL